MKDLLFVCVGGGIGAVTRYLLGGWVTQHTPDWKFPAGTFAVNVLGCLIAGILAGLVETYKIFSEDGRLFLFVGVLGGFTTFSAFGLETVNLLRRQETGIAAGYVVLSVLCGIGCLWLGMQAVRLTAR